MLRFWLAKASVYMCYPFVLYVMLVAGESCAAGKAVVKSMIAEIDDAATKRFDRYRDRALDSQSESIIARVVATSCG